MHNLRAILLIIGSMAFFTVEDMFIKHLSGFLPVGQVLLSIAVASAAIFLIWALVRHDPVFVARNWRPLILIRASTEAVASVAFVTALSRVDISTVGAVFQSMPLAVTLGAAVFLKESVGWRRWCAIVVGFIGVLMIIRPGVSGFEPQALWVLVSVVAVATRDLMTRVMDAAVPSTVVSFQAFLAVIPAALLNLWLSGATPLAPDLPLMIKTLFAIVAGAAGYTLIVAGMRLGDASAVTPFRYSRLVFTMIGGVLIFGERPDLMTLAGSALIIASGLYTFLRERKLARLDRETLSADLETPRV
ncbi:DMT family transporter [Celeribacter persicus]|uniref:Drug/metabolite transporter (DMT)-like permease n=1 Tax=Celeribacter persicus TaxID=1651082 RepID=A0A2T5HAH1_9RHOB|nr:DMT family transporter [Celeribacter persicus]PTQ68580.1 drug/metabolite transporter (DMT)-like permease [Celeribacter persicus]